MDASVITVTSKGQIAIPVSIRKELSIESGDKLVAYTYGDLIMLKVLKVPEIERFQAMAKEAQEWAQSVGLKEEEVDTFIKEYRKKKRNENSR